MSILLCWKSYQRLLVVVGLALVSLGWAAPARAAPFVYVTNISNESISQYDAVGGTLAPLSPASVGTGGNEPLGIAVSPDAKNVYVGTFSVTNTGTIVQYTVGTDGALTLKSSTASADTFPESLAISPNGQSLYVVNRFGSQALLQYTVQADGSLTPKSPATVPTTGPGPEKAAVSPDSRSVYVTDTVSGLSTVSQYTAAADGTLTPKSPPIVATGSTPSAEPYGIAVSPDGKNVYVADFEANVALDGSVFQYTVASGGTLSPKSPASVAATGHPIDLAVSPNGSWVYATNEAAFGAGTVLQYTVGIDGALTPKSPLAVPGGAFPFGIAISGDSKSVYAADQGSNAVSQFSVSADGALSPRSPATVPAGGSPHQIAITPVRVPTSKEQCMNGGWRNFPQFKNQGDCVSFVATHGKNPPG